MKRVRKLGFVALGAVAVLAIAASTMPWWLGAALGVVGGRFGVTFGEYERIGYGRFSLSEVVVERPGVRVEASRVEAPTPLRWLMGGRDVVNVGTWRVVAEGQRSAAGTPPPRGGWPAVQARVERVMRELETYLPEASAGAGEVVWRTGKVSLDAATWGGGRLSVARLVWREWVADEVVVSRERAGRLEARVVMKAEDAEARVWAEKGRLEAEGRWWAQPWAGRVQFAEIGWIPEEAKLEARDWRVPAARIKVGEFYDEVSGEAGVAWKAGKFAVEARALGVPKAAGEVPSLNVDVRAQGDRHEVRVEALEVRVPGVDAVLNEPVVVGRNGFIRSGRSLFRVRADLAQLPWVKGAGVVSGTVEVFPESNALPVVEAKLESAGVSVGEWQASEARVDAVVAWPRVELKAARLKLASGDLLEGYGEGDVRARTVKSLVVSGRVSRELVARWAPEVGFGEAEFEVQAAGAWPGLTHTGKLNARGVRVAPVKELDLEVVWAGRDAELQNVEVTAATKDGARVSARGAVGRTEAKVESLEIWRTADEGVRSTGPARVSWSPTLVVDGLRLEGGERLLAGSLVWADAGRAQADVREIGKEWMDAFVDVGGPAWRVSSLKAEATWDGGPMRFEVAGGATTAVGKERRAELAVAMRGDARGVRVDTLLGAMEGRSVMSATGILPVVFFPRAETWWRTEEEGELALAAETAPNAYFWEQLGALTGLKLDEPEVRVALSGTAREPRGEAVARVKRVSLARLATGRAEGPDVTEIAARVEAGREGLALRELTMRVAGQEVRAEGRVPAGKVRELLRRPAAVLAEAGEARIAIPEASVAALSRFAPAYLAPLGTLQADVQVKPGAKLGGFVQLKDAATRPLGPLGTLQSLGAELVFEGRRLELKRVGATMGGQPVTLTGTVELQAGGEPRLDVALKGERLPFVRQAGLLVRGDVDLRVVTGDDAVTRITGVTRLRDSLFLMDVRALLPSGGPRGAPGKRPPYFAVTTPPVDAWALDVAVKGDRFLRLRTPVFNGVVSADFRLQGTLGDPRAIGQATIDQGQVLLPFANFTVLQGGVRLTESNPFEPTVSLIGTSRRYGYLLRMEVAGTADQPRLTFSSTPPLESEQVLLMVMAGETPQKEVTYTGRERATRLGAYLGQSLLGQLGADPSESERLSISVGERISEQGRETYGIEYELTPRWSLIGEYDEFDAYNLGVKWRVWSEKPKDVRGKEGADEGAK